MTTIPENFDKLRNAIRKSERKAGREEGGVHLTAVTKTQNPDVLLAALSCGHRLFGENKVQEAQSHWRDLKPQYPDLKLHLIGPLQTNKAGDAVDLFDVIETLDREKLSLELSKEQKKQNKELEYFIQVNTGEEDQKAGIAPQDVTSFLKFCCGECALNVTGLMCIPPVNEPAALHFALLKKLAGENGLKHLSMGMSSDFEKAIAMGATHIRIGTALFGERVKTAPESQ